MKPGGFNNQRILVVDTDYSALMAMRSYLLKKNHEVDCAWEIEEALKLLDTVGYSMVFLDLRLTGFDGGEGLEIISHVREQCPGTRIVVLDLMGMALRRPLDSVCVEGWDKEVSLMEA